MSIWILANTVSHAAPEVRVVDVSNNPVDASESAGIDVVRGGPRSLSWTQDGTDSRRVWYVNKTTDLRTDFCVWVNAINRDGQSYSIRRSNAGFSTETTIVSGTMAAPYVGIDGSDKVFQFTLAEDAMFSVNGANGLELRQVYFSDGLEFQFTTIGTPVQFSPIPVWAPPVRHADHYYKLHAQSEIQVVATDQQVEDYYALDKSDPLFLYDSTGTASQGDHILHKLWHCVISAETVMRREDDLNFITMEVGILRHGSG